MKFKPRDRVKHQEKGPGRLVEIRGSVAYVTFDRDPFFENGVRVVDLELEEKHGEDVQPR